MKKIVLSVLITLTCVFSFSAITAIPNSALASKETSNYTNACPNASFLTFKAWFAGNLCDKNGNIGIDNKADSSGLQRFIWTVVLNVVDNIFQLIGYVSAGFLIYGGYLWIFSQGKPEMITKGRQTITNAIVGLVIALFATLIVNVILGLF